MLIETASTGCSVAITSPSVQQAILCESESQPQSEVISVLTGRLITEAGISYSRLSGVAVSSGPGSYTGLRIGVSFAKGLCYALDIPLYSISTLEIMAYGFMKNYPDFKGLICPMMDARRMEVYTALFDNELTRIHPDRPMVIDDNSWKEFPPDPKIAFFGNGAEKCVFSMEKHPGFISGMEASLSASNMHDSAIKKFQMNQFEDLAYFEPAYLKPYQGKIKTTQEGNTLNF